MSNLNDTQKIQQAFSAHLRNPDKHAAPEGIEERRLAIYRDLIYRNIESFLAGGFPILKTIYENQSDATTNWQHVVQSFLDDYTCDTPYFLEISQEFQQFLQTDILKDQPAYLQELAHYEWVELALDVSEARLPGEYLIDDLLRSTLRMSPLAMNLSYRYPVHKIGSAYQPSEDDVEPAFLVVYRNEDDAVKFMQVNALTSHLLTVIDQAAQHNAPLSGQAALKQVFLDLEQANQVAGQANTMTEAQLLQFGLPLLQQLNQQSVILPM